MSCIFAYKKDRLRCIFVQINNLSMPLYTLAVIDQHGMGCPVIQSLVYREDQAHIQMLLKCAQEWTDPTTFSNTVFVVDKAQAEISALQSLFPGNRILLCRFHVAKAFVQEIKKSALTSDDQESLYKVWKNFVYSAEYKVMMKCMHWLDDDDLVILIRNKCYLNKSLTAVYFMQFTGHSKIVVFQ